MRSLVSRQRATTGVEVEDWDSLNSHVATKTCNEICGLFLYQLMMTEKQFSWLSGVVRHLMRQLKKLDLSSVGMEDRNCQELCRSLEGGQIRLVSLKLCGNNLGPASGPSIGHYISSLNGTELTTLRLRFNKLGTSGFLAIVKRLANHPSIRVLDVGTNHITSSGLREAGRSLSCSSNNIRKLYLYGNDISDEGMISLRPYLIHKRANHLSILDLWTCGLGVESGTILGDVCGNQNSLQEIKLSNNTLTDEGTRLLCQGILRGNRRTPLSVLDLSANVIGDDSHTSLISVIKKQKVRTLNIRDNQLSLDPCLLLIQAAVSNKVLHILNIARNHLTITDCDMICVASHACKTCTITFSPFTCDTQFTQSSYQPSNTLTALMSVIDPDAVVSGLDEGEDASNMVISPETREGSPLYIAADPEDDFAPDPIPQSVNPTIVHKKVSLTDIMNSAISVPSPAKDGRSLHVSDIAGVGIELNNDRKKSNYAGNSVKTLSATGGFQTTNNKIDYRVRDQLTDTNAEYPTSVLTDHSAQSSPARRQGFSPSYVIQNNVNSFPMDVPFTNHGGPGQGIEEKIIIRNERSFHQKSFANVSADERVLKMNSDGVNKGNNESKSLHVSEIRQMQSSGGGGGGHDSFESLAAAVASFNPSRYDEGSIQTNELILEPNSNTTPQILGMSELLRSSSPVESYPSYDSKSYLRPDLQPQLIPTNTSNRSLLPEQESFFLQQLSSMPLSSLEAAEQIISRRRQQHSSLSDHILDGTIPQQNTNVGIDLHHNNNNRNVDKSPVPISPQGRRSDVEEDPILLKSNDTQRDLSIEVQSENTPSEEFSVQIIGHHDPTPDPALNQSINQQPASPISRGVSIELVAVAESPRKLNPIIMINSNSSPDGYYRSGSPSPSKGVSKKSVSEPQENSPIVSRTVAERVEDWETRNQSDEERSRTPKRAEVVLSPLSVTPPREESSPVSSRHSPQVESPRGVPASPMADKSPSKSPTHTQFIGTVVLHDSSSECSNSDSGLADKSPEKQAAVAVESPSPRESPSKDQLQEAVEPVRDPSVELFPGDEEQQKDISKQPVDDQTDEEVDQQESDSATDDLCLSETPGAGGKPQPQEAVEEPEQQDVEPEMEIDFRTLPAAQKRAPLGDDDCRPSKSVFLRISGLPITRPVDTIIQDSPVPEESEDGGPELSPMSQKSKDNTPPEADSDSKPESPKADRPPTPPEIELSDSDIPKCSIPKYDKSVIRDSSKHISCVSIIVSGLPKVKLSSQSSNVDRTPVQLVDLVSTQPAVEEEIQKPERPPKQRTVTAPTVVSAIEGKSEEEVAQENRIKEVSDKLRQQDGQILSEATSILKKQKIAVRKADREVIANNCFLQPNGPSGVRVVVEQNKYIVIKQKRRILKSPLLYCIPTLATASPQNMVRVNGEFLSLFNVFIPKDQPAHKTEWITLKTASPQAAAAAAKKLVDRITSVVGRRTSVIEKQHPLPQQQEQQQHPQQPQQHPQPQPPLPPPSGPQEIRQPDSQLQQRTQ